MVSFIEDNHNQVADYLHVVEALEEQNQRIVQLMSKVQNVDLNIKTSKEYIHRELLMADKAAGILASPQVYKEYMEYEESSGRWSESNNWYVFKK